MSDNKANVPSNISGQESSVCNLIRSGYSRKMISMGTWKNETQRRQMKITTLAPDCGHGRTLQSRTGRSTPKSKVMTYSHRGLCVKSFPLQRKITSKQGRTSFVNERRHSCLRSYSSLVYSQSSFCSGPGQQETVSLRLLQTRLHESELSQV